jgi:hypothetical protein
MFQETKMLNQKRDYDIHPIVIKDYNYIFVPLGMFLVFLWLLYIIIDSTTPVSAGATASMRHSRK